VQISRSGFLKQDSPGTPRDVESEVAAKDTDEGVVCIAPTSSGSLPIVELTVRVMESYLTAAFVYQPEQDSFLCPAGQTLKRDQISRKDRSV
jgi:hypothetical protein